MEIGPAVAHDGPLAPFRHGLSLLQPIRPHTYLAAMSAGFIAPDQDPEVEDLLVRIVEMAMSVPRPKRQFHVLPSFGPGGTVDVICAGSQVEAAPQDLKALRSAGLIENVGPVDLRSGSYGFALTRKGTVLAQSVKQRGEPLAQVEHEPVRYIEGAEFKARYPEAAHKWAHAARLLAEDPIWNTTRIGHDCREALAAFASALVDRHNAHEFGSGGGTVDSVRAVIKGHRPPLGETVSAFLDALVAYWGTVSDLAQRQEHAAQREGEPLIAVDARRVVWYSALVMYEFDRTFD